MRKAIAVVVVGSSLVVGGAVVAQSTGPKVAQVPPAPTPPPAPAPNVPPAQTPAPAASPPGAPKVNAPVRVRANISIPEMTAQANAYVGKMNEILKHLVELQEVARRQKDVVRLNCVNDRLLQLKQLLNIADQAQNNMLEAMARGDDDARYHEFGRVTIANQQAQVLSSEADNCVGEELSFLGKTSVTVEEPNIPEDPTLQQGPDFPVVEPLPVASPQM